MNCNVYKPDLKWWVIRILKLLVIGVVIGILFFDTFWVSPIVCILFSFLLLKEKKKYIATVKAEITKEFKEFIIFLSGNVNAGYSLEKAVTKCISDLEQSNKDFKYLLPQLRRIQNGINLNIDTQTLLIAMGENLKVEDIIEFASLVSTAKHYGGDITRLIEQNRKSIENRMSVEAEIHTMISAKKLEGMIMIVMPFFIVGYMRFINPGYMDFMYENIVGRVVMWVALIVVVLMILSIEKIVKIEV